MRILYASLRAWRALLGVGSVDDGIAAMNAASKPGPAVHSGLQHASARVPGKSGGGAGVHSTLAPPFIPGLRAWCTGIAWAQTKPVAVRRFKSSVERRAAAFLCPPAIQGGLFFVEKDS